MGSKPKSQLIGYEYYMGMHLAICHGPVDAILSIEAGEKEIWSGSITTSQSLSIKKPNIFGGNRKEGGIVGSLDIMMGSIDQAQNSYLQSKLGQNIPSYRGVLSFVLKKMYLTAMTPYIKPWAFKLRRFPSKGWNDNYSNISGGANAIHIIREALTDASWGLGYSVGRVDDPTFSAAAKGIFEEGFGLSLILSGQSSIEDFITDILKHISAVLFTDEVTGNFKIKLIRDDYSIDSLKIFNESNILKLNNFERPQYAEMVNEIVLVYRPQGTRKNSSISVQDLASVQAQGGIISQTITYIGIDNVNIAGRVAQRELRQHSTPLAQIRITVNRYGWELSPGDTFLFNWEKHGIVDLVCRVLSVDLGDLNSSEILIDAVEDIFALPKTTYISEQPSEWVDPIGQPVASSLQAAKEINYWDIQTGFTSAAIQDVDPSSAYLELLVKEPPISSPGYLLSTKTNTAPDYINQQTGEYTPNATLVNDIDYLDTIDIEISNPNNIETFPVGNYGYINDEIIRIDLIDISNNKINIGRGCLDTVAQKHLSGSIIWLSEDFEGQDSTEYVSGETVLAKALVQTGDGLLDISQAPASTILMKGRQDRPYPPGKFRLNTLPYPQQITGPLVVTWAHRDRTLQLARPIISEEIGNIGPETGVTYTIELYSETGTLARTVTGLTVTSYEWTTEEADSLLTGRLNKKVTIKLWAVRSGVESYQIYDFQVNRPVDPEIITAPIITGAHAVGELLTCSEGVWDNSPTSFEYQWLRDNVDIPNEIINTYLITADDKGKTLTCKVKAINEEGSTTSLSSNSVLIAGASIIAKSVVFNITDNWGSTSGTGVRSIDFYLNNTKLELTSSDFAPLGLQYSTNFHVRNAFVTALSKTGSFTNTSWFKNSMTNLSIAVVFNSLVTFDKIVINNNHSYGADVDRGVKNIIIIATPDALTATSYSYVITNGTTIFTGVIPQHVATDTADDYVVPIVIP